MNNHRSGSTLPDNGHEHPDTPHPSPPPSHLLFPSTAYSSLIFASNLQPPYVNRPNSFEQISSPFEQRSNPYDPCVHDHPAPVRPPSPAPERLLIQSSPKGLCIEINDEAMIDISRPSMQQLSGGPYEWPIGQGYPEPVLDMFIDDEGLTILDKIYLYCSSENMQHKTFIAHAMPTFLPQIAPQDAVDYVIPLLSELAMDEEDAVKEALAAELINIMWWFLVHCRVVEEDPMTGDSYGPSTCVTPLPTTRFPSEGPAWTTCSETLISAQTFTPILGTLLLNPNVIVGGSARGAVVELLRRIKLADNKGNRATAGASQEVDQQFCFPTNDEERESSLGLFQRRERELFERELLYQVVIGMGRLDMSPSDFDEGLTPGAVEHWRKSPLLTPNRQPPSEKGDSYFLNVPHKSPPPSSSPSPVITVDRTLPEAEFDSVITDSPSQGSEGSTPELSPGNSESSIVSPSDSESEDQCLSTSVTRSPPIEMEVSRAGGIISEGLYKDQDNWHSQVFETKMLFPSPCQNDIPLHTPPSVDEERRQWVAIEHENEIHEVEFHDVGYEGGETLGHMGDDGESEQAAVGRLSSMSLMAAVAANSPLAEDIQAAFVKEVKRVGRDPVFWVRRESSYALGALAKVVPAEIVVSCLLPLLESLCQDTVWHVRSSALVALPAILSKLSPERRRIVALNTMLPLAEDASSSVRSGVLEALGEVLYTFQKDEDVPRELLDLFLGRGDGGEQENESFDDREQPPRTNFYDNGWPEYRSWGSGDSTDDQDSGETRTIWNDPDRSLICAFNYPVVALTLGRERWVELRDLYKRLSRCSQFKVKRTLAASLGELARIIGPENARTDLMDVFRASIHDEEGEVRLKAIEALEAFVVVVSDENKWEIVETIAGAWEQAYMKGWRERESIVRLLKVLIESEEGSPDEFQSSRGVRLLKSMIMRGLGDDVASVRDAAISVIPAFSRAWRHRRPEALQELLADVRAMADDAKYIRRMTFVACQQQLLLEEGVELMADDPTLWELLQRLGSDTVPGVRIGVARLLSEIFDKYHRNTEQGLEWIYHLAGRLDQDSSKDVRSFVSSILDSTPPHPQRPLVQNDCSLDLSEYHKFSRPPPLPVKTETSVGITRGEEGEVHESPTKMAEADATGSQGPAASAYVTDVPPSTNASRAMHILSTPEDTRSDRAGDNEAHNSLSTLDLGPQLIRTKSEQSPVFA